MQPTFSPTGDGLHEEQVTFRAGWNGVRDLPLLLLERECAIWGNLGMNLYLDGGPVPSEWLEERMRKWA